MLEKVTPYSPEAEMAVLGSMLIDRESLDRALERLTEKSFYDGNHQKIFSVMQDLTAKTRRVDIVLVTEELRRQEQLASCGGAEYLTRLIDSVATTAHIEDYIQMVEEKALLRELIQASNQIIAKCQQEQENVDELIDEVEGMIYKIADQKRKPGLVPISQMLHDLIENLEKLHKEKKQITGVPTGFRKFDDLTAGLQPGNLIIIAARPGVGKTSFALNLATHVAMKEKRPVAIFSLEMSKNEILMRLLSSVTRIPLHKLRTGFFQKSEWPAITRSAGELSEAPICLDDTSAVSILSLRAAARRLSTEYRNKGNPLALIIIDYLQLMQGSRKNPENRQQEISEISRSLKALARDLNIPIVALSQLNRSPEEKGREGKPQLSHLRESGALEQDADLVAFIYREALYKSEVDEELKRKAKLIVAKQRNGPIGEVDLVFLGELARFENLEQETE